MVGTSQFVRHSSSEVLCLASSYTPLLLSAYFSLSTPTPTAPRPHPLSSPDGRYRESFAFLSPSSGPPSSCPCCPLPSHPPHIFLPYPFPPLPLWMSVGTVGEVLCLVLTVLYALLFTASLVQLSRILYFQHDLKSFQFGFLIVSHECSFPTPPHCPSLSVNTPDPSLPPLPCVV